MSGARIPGVVIALIAQDGKVRFTVSDRDGRYLVKDLPAGKYLVWAWTKGFALYERGSISVGRGRNIALDIRLEVENQQPMVPGRELPRTVHDPTRNLPQGAGSSAGGRSGDGVLH
jgi:hypothetical protein